MIIHNVLLCRESKLKNVFFREPRKYLGSLTFTWEQRKFSDITFPAGEKNKDNLPLESYSITNEHGFVPQDEKFENGGTMREADKRMYYIVSPNSFAYNPARINVGSIGYQNIGKNVIVSSLYEVFKTSEDVDDRLLWHWFKSPDFQKLIMQLQEGGVRLYFYYDKLCMGEVSLPLLEEQRKIGKLFDTLDNLITLHQRECKYIKLEANVLSRIKETDLFCDYYDQWIKVYKEGAVRKVTMDKYRMTYSWLKRLAPSLRLCDVTRVTYQQILNNYAVCHERQTTMDFHHQLKGAIIDAVDDGLIAKDPTRKAIIKGKTPAAKKIKYLNQYELHTLLSELDLRGDINWDWLILLTAKTGMRFSEVLALTPNDFDFAHQMLLINKTWDYKGNGGFLPTKNRSSVRKIQIDWQTVIQFSELVKKLPPDKPIFVQKERVYNSTVNDILARHCQKANIPIISVHGLRHTHASLLLFAGVSIASVARRLGHSSMTTTQKTYLHIIQELENQDVDLVMRSLSGLS